MNASVTYANNTLENISPIYPDILINMKTQADCNSSFSTVWTSPTMFIPLGYSYNVLPLEKESFIGMLSNDEARKMKQTINLFKKNFDDDLARRNNILFGE
jgi:hypothetical protein